MKCIGVLFVLTATYCWSQAPAIEKAETSGPCSSATTGSNNNFTIDCGIGKEKGQKMLSILNRILTKQLDPNLVMAKLEEIGKDVKKPSRGIYSQYEFNGLKHEQSSGECTTIVGEEVGVFQNMTSLFREQRWKELLSLSEDQIKKTPAWLTPYLFSGVANANLGNKSAAIERLKFVQEEAAGDPNYSEAEVILRSLQP
jgi:hypothetical protein